MRTLPYLKLTLILPIFLFSFGENFSSADSGEASLVRYLKGLSIEDLLQTEITSVSKKNESLFTAAAAVTVITQEDILRSGARNIPEALRMVPGLAVSNIDGSRYAVGSRGFNEYFETKLLVLVDGRSLYQPLFSGVYWNVIDTIMQDIERIEVIRGPGATVWGANAVNGVINVITKSSANTQGGVAELSYGSHDKPEILARYGGRINKDTTYRLYAKGNNRDSYESLEGGDAHDSWNSWRSGFRMDSISGKLNTFSLQGEIYDGEADAESNLSGYLTPPFVRNTEETEDYRGGHLLGLWEYEHEEDAVTSLQFYYDHSDSDRVVAREKRDTFDIELKHQWRLMERHDIVFGASYRWTGDDIDGSFSTSFDPDSSDDELWSTFIQDDIAVLEDVVWVTLGSKFEYNDYSGFEIQPSLRLRWQLREKQLLWGAVSKAVRTPSRAEQDISINLRTFSDSEGNLQALRLMGDEAFDSEELIAYELGYRWQPRESLSFDVATFYNDYDRLRSFGSAAPFFEVSPVPRLVIPIVFTNEAEGEAYGLEFQSTWQPLENLKISAAYSFIELELVDEGELAGPGTASREDFSPEHQFNLRIYYDLMPGVSLDSGLYYVSELGDGIIDDYVRWDLQLGWQASDWVRLTIAGENLIGSSHQEFFSEQSNIVASEVPRQYWLKATFTF